MADVKDNKPRNSNRKFQHEGNKNINRKSLKCSNQDKNLDLSPKKSQNRRKMQENLVKLSQTGAAIFKSEEPPEKQPFKKHLKKEQKTWDQNRNNVVGNERPHSETKMKGLPDSRTGPQLKKNVVFEDEDEDDNDTGDDILPDSNETSTDQDYAEIKKELANISFEDLEKLKERVGLKKFNSIVHGKTEVTSKKKQVVYKRENSNRPREMSSKMPVPVLRQIDDAKKKTGRDPRFDDLSGEFKESYFNKDYAFLSDMKAKEKEKVEKKMKKEKNAEKKMKLKALLKKMEQEAAIVRQKEQREELDRKVKAKERELVKEGKTPYFLKKAERRKLELAERFRELKKTGKVDKYLIRKRKKNAEKERKKMKF